jgi:hypothetical protein
MMRRPTLAWLISLACLGCAEPRVTGPRSKAIGQTTMGRLNSPQPRGDLLFVIDNSASMAAKQAMVLQRLATVIQELRAFEGGIPDMHIGVVSTDLGAGAGEAGGDCAVPLGDRGLLWGNDPSPGARATVAGGISKGCGLAEGARWIETRTCPDGERSIRNYTGDLADVFTCMVRAMGTHGCGYSHALQATRLALDPQPGINEGNRGFLRDSATLSVIFVADKDDCSAPSDAVLNDGLFSAKIPGYDPVLRCAARGHVCGGQAIPNYDPLTGYDGSQGPFTHDFNGCAAKRPTNPPDPHWLPLLSVQEVIDGIRALTGGWDSFTAMTGIFGWPQTEGSGRPIYKMDATSAEGLSGLSPICSLPSIEGEGGNVYPSLRLKEFVDAFAPNVDSWGPRSMCSDDWKGVARVADNHILYHHNNACISFPLIDRDPNTSEVQPDCQISMTIAGDDSGVCGGEPAHEVAIPECADVDSGLPVNPANPRPQLDAVPEDRRPCWYFLHDRDENTGCPKAFEHQKLAILYRPGQVPPPGATWTATCQTGTCPPVNGQRCD